MFFGNIHVVLALVMVMIFSATFSVSVMVVVVAERACHGYNGGSNANWTKYKKTQWHDTLVNFKYNLNLV